MVLSYGEAPGNIGKLASRATRTYILPDAYIEGADIARVRFGDARYVVSARLWRGEKDFSLGAVLGLQLCSSDSMTMRPTPGPCS